MLSHESVRRFVALQLLLVVLLVACPNQGQAQDVYALLDSARVAQSSGDYAGAAAFYARATTLSPITPELWSNRGVMEYLAGQTDASIASLEHALRLNPILFTPMLFLGKAYVTKGNSTLALRYLTRAKSRRPNDSEVLLAMGKAYSDLNQQRKAESSYASTVRLAPDKAEAWFGLGAAALEVIAADGRDLADLQAKSIWARALYADDLFAQGRPLEATDTYKAVLAAASPTQITTLARNIQWLESHPGLFPIAPNSQEALLQLDAELAPRRGHDSPSLSPCPPTAPALEIAACAFWAGDYERSAAQAGQELQRSPQNAEALYWSIKANERMAVAALAQFEQLAPQSAASYVMVGDLYRYQQNMDSALSEYRKALAIDSHNPAALMGAVVANFSLSKPDDAIATDQVALGERPLDPQLNLLMAEILASKNQYGQVKPYLERCTNAPPELQPRVHLLMARADVEVGKTEEAIHQFEMALPGDVDGSTHYQLSRLYRKTGNLIAAQKAEEEAKNIMKQRRAHAVIDVREAIGTTP